MEFHILPHVGVNDIRLNSYRDSFLSILGKPDITRKESDFYYQGILRLDYDDENRLEYIEINNNRNISVFFKETDLFKNSADNVIKFIKQMYTLNENTPEAGYTFVFHEIDLGLWRDIIPINNECLDGKYFLSVGIGRKDYYDFIKG